MQISKSLNIYIVEDMALTRLGLVKHIHGFGHKVVGSAARANTAYSQITQLSVDLVLIDINLQGKDDGIWLAKQIKDNLQIPFIYLTAYNDEETMKRLSKTEPSGYIMKPYNKSTLEATINIAYYKFEQLNNIINTETTVAAKVNFILVNDGLLKIKLEFDQILYINSEGNFVQFHTQDKVYRNRSRFKDIEEIVSSYNFVKVNKGLLVNLSKAKGYNNDCVLVNDLSFPISRLHRKNVKEYFNV